MKMIFCDRETPVEALEKVRVFALSELDFDAMISIIADVTDGRFQRLVITWPDDMTTEDFAGRALACYLLATRTLVRELAAHGVDRDSALEHIDVVYDSVRASIMEDSFGIHVLGNKDMIPMPETGDA